MEEGLDNDGILMYSTHNESASVITERFVKPLHAKIYKESTANDSKPYLPYLNKLVDQCNNTYHHSIDKKPINVDYSALVEKVGTNLKAPKFKFNDRVRISVRISIRISQKYKNIFSIVKVTQKIGQEKYLLLILL